MAQKAGQKRKRNRKARTEVSSSSSSSESESGSQQHSMTQDTAKRLSEDGDDPGDDSKSSESSSSEVEAEDASSHPPPIKVDPEQAFEDFYLKQATKEFANDLDKLRSASDFKEGSVPMLIEALKQGKACFGSEERRRVGDAAARAAGEGNGQ